MNDMTSAVAAMAQEPSGESSESEFTMHVLVRYAS
jgi:hypothetical protein